MPDIDPKELERLRRAHAVAAAITVEDEQYAPIFDRLDRELEMIEHTASRASVARARATVRRVTKEEA